MHMKHTDTLTADQIGKMRDEYLLPSTMKYFPMNIVKGEMQFVYDDAGKKYLDAFSAVVTISVGHCHPDVTNPMVEQIKTLQHMTTLYYHPNLVRYAEKMAEIMPGGLKVSFFTNSGCEANELAALLAKNYTKNTEFVGLRHSFHGRTLMAMTLTGQSKWRHSLPYVFGVTHAPAAYCYRCPLGLKYPSCNIACAREVEDIIKYNTSGKIAGFIAEPIQGFGGCITPPKEYFEIVYEIVRKYGGVCISDEVQTGFGRTGDKWWGIEQWGVKPDMITMAKGMGNGVPLGGVTCSTAIAESMREKIHFNTYGGNPVSMAAGLAVVECIERHDYMRNAKAMGDLLAEGFDKLARDHKIVGEHRGLGLMRGIELVKTKEGKEVAPEYVQRAMELCRDRGVLIGRGGMAANTIRIKPPYCIDKNDVAAILKALDESFTIIEKG